MALNETPPATDERLRMLDAIQHYAAVYGRHRATHSDGAKAWASVIAALDAYRDEQQAGGAVAALTKQPCAVNWYANGTCLSPVVANDPCDRCRALAATTDPLVAMCMDAIAPNFKLTWPLDENKRRERLRLTVELALAKARLEGQYDPRTDSILRERKKVAALEARLAEDV